MSSTSDSAAAPRHVLVADADPATLGLIGEWLAAEGGLAVDERDAAADARFDLVLVDIAYPRQGGLERLRRLAAERPGVPIVVMSATFFGNVACTGGCAGSLGVAGVLAKPITRTALLDAVHSLSAAKPR